MFGRKKKPELDYKSRAIAIMHLQRKVDDLQNELNTAPADKDTFGTEYDMKCLKKTIKFLEVE